MRGAASAALTAPSRAKNRDRVSSVAVSVAASWAAARAAGPAGGPSAALARGAAVRRAAPASTPAAARAAAAPRTGVRVEEVMPSRPDPVERVGPGELGVVHVPGVGGPVVAVAGGPGVAPVDEAVGVVVAVQHVHVAAAGGPLDAGLHRAAGGYLRLHGGVAQPAVDVRAGVDAGPVQAV